MDVARRRFSLTLSDNKAIDTILLDIPFFCIGIMTFGISTFALIMKRFNLLGLCLHLSALLAFAASIFDLSQILSRGASDVSAGIGANAVQGLIKTREISLALSLGARYLFYWIFVAQKPRYEAEPNSQSNNFSPRHDAHSGSWQRWGYLGVVLKWGLLGLTISIPVLQLIWRLAQREFRFIYMADNTIQIVTASLFILKLFLNIYLCSTVPPWQLLASFIAPIFALLISVGIGVGNLTFFDLSDTTLGHFLQALELYILIVYLLVITFLPEKFAHRRLESQQGQQSPPQVKQDYNDSQKAGHGMLNRPDAITSPRRFASFVSPPPTQYMDRPPVAVVERGSPINGYDSRQNRDVERDAGWDQYANQLSDNEDVESFIEVVNTTRGLSAPDAIPPRSPARSATVSFSSYYNAGHSTFNLPPAPPSFARLGNDSPVYGLNGIISRVDSPSDAGTTRSPSHGATAHTSLAATSDLSFDELLRQQDELDKSIAALRLFSTRDSVVSVPDPTSSQSLKKTQVSSVAASFSSGPRADTLSAKSEFSLSVFPEPPMQIQIQLAPDPPTPQPTMDSPQMSTDVPFSPLLLPRQMTGDGSHPDDSLDSPSSLPTSPRHPGVSHARFDSAGTQYDVTSFIDDLTEPRPVGLWQRPISALRGGGLSDVESGDESPTMLVARDASVMDSATPTTLTSMPSSPRREPEETLPAPPPLRPFLLGHVTSPPVVSSPLSAAPVSASHIPRNAQAIGPRRPIAGRQGLSGTYRPRLKISAPRPSGYDMVGSPDGIDSPEAYERPRPPPLIVPQNWRMVPD